jgi:hypothetical protein
MLTWFGDSNSSADEKVLSWSNTNNQGNSSKDGKMLSWSNRSNSSENQHLNKLSGGSVLSDLRAWSLAESNDGDSRFASIEDRKLGQQVLSLFRSWIRTKPEFARGGLLNGSQVMSALASDKGREATSLARLFGAAGFGKASGDQLLTLIRGLFQELGGSSALKSQHGAASFLEETATFGLSEHEKKLLSWLCRWMLTDHIPSLRN